MNNEEFTNLYKRQKEFEISFLLKRLQKENKELREKLENEQQSIQESD